MQYINEMHGQRKPIVLGSQNVEYFFAYALCMLSVKNLEKKNIYSSISIF
jgi:hypothetical protein